MEFECAKVEPPCSGLLVMDVNALAGLCTGATFFLTLELLGEVLWAESIG